MSKKTNFKIGDKVKFIDKTSGAIAPSYSCDSSYVKHGTTELSSEYYNTFATVVGFYDDKVAVKFPTTGRDGYTCLDFKPKYLELVSKKRRRPVKEDFTRYMVYGIGCDNKSDLMMTEIELKDALRTVSKDKNWTGRIIGYKMVPIFEAEEKTMLKIIKPIKKKKK